ncbi:MAG: class I SAM-dependent rRNA methyltransferase [Planctomycetes bacterium]|nr:class I SAM-dependent rRNA methyltransferase [Planctomycetota bacterium]
MTPTAVVRVKRGRAKPLFCRHPWLFSGAVDKTDGEFEAGDIVEVLDHNGAFIGRGYINAESRILVRLLTWDKDEPIDADFWRRRIADAVEMRVGLLNLPAKTDACRLIFSEADFLPGLIADRYGQHLVVQFLTAGVNARREEILDILEELCTPAAVFERNESSYQETEGTSPGGLVRGQRTGGPVEIAENGLRFLVDIENGQKTGFYLDQRDNRLAAARFAEGKSVLDCFSYTGAFAIYAAKLGGASRVVAVDSSEAAVELGRENARRNEVDNVEFRRGDVTEEIRALKESGETFDMAVLDPPKLARSRAGVARASKKYIETNLQAIRVLKPNGVLVTCSCSQHIDEDTFVRLVSRAGREMGRKVQIVEYRSQAPDHPVSAACPETKYLKCLICRVL